MDMSDRSFGVVDNPLATVRSDRQESVEIAFENLK